MQENKIEYILMISQANFYRQSKKHKLVISNKEEARFRITHTSELEAIKAYLKDLPNIDSIANRKGVIHPLNASQCFIGLYNADLTELLMHRPINRTLLEEKYNVTQILVSKCQ